LTNVIRHDKPSSKTSVDLASGRGKKTYSQEYKYRQFSDSNWTSMNPMQNIAAAKEAKKTM